MPRYFLEVSYKGEGYSGFQVQQNAHTIQAEVEAAFRTVFRRPVQLTGSSRTDAGVHARQNFFHFDWEGVFDQNFLYNLNALLPPAVVLRNVYAVADTAHCRFAALSRLYHYTVYQQKDPFLHDRGWYFPYRFDGSLLHELAGYVLANTYFYSFSKRNTQVHTYNCCILESRWVQEHEYIWRYEVRANRFLRGMVRGLVGTMLRVARGNMPVATFRHLLEGQAIATADFSAPGKGLVLQAVEYPAALLR